VIQHIPTPLTAKNLEAAGKKIVAHITAGDQAKEKAVEHYKAAGLLLLDVSNKHPKDFTAFLTRSCAALGRSRAYELMQMAGGRKTVEQIRADTKKRVDRHRAKNKQRPLQKPVTDQPEVADAPTIAPNPEPTSEASAEQRKAQYAAQDPAAIEAPAIAPELPIDALKATPKSKKSKRALAEFKVAVDLWFAMMDPADKAEAATYATSKVAAS
jgi:hypothetical protein